MAVVSLDLDGTLVTCPEPRERSFEHARDEADLSVPLPPVEPYRSAFHESLLGRFPERAPDAPVRRRALRRAFESAGTAVSDADIAAFADAYRRRRLDRLIPMDGAEALLDALSATHAVVVVTNGPAELQREKLDRTGLTARVDALAVAGCCGTAKPDPTLFEIAFERAGESMASAVHVGDARFDVEGAIAAGLDPIFLRPGPVPEWLPADVPTCRSLDAVRRLILDDSPHSVSG
ncbi:MAG: HAD family hydrolase [Halobacteriota archaeon]